ncbi:hypothetical protein [Falsirhodobacter sp. 20TX0035]|uniref:hypothetical protein n=1 Tax=Falsirhodobacter sp. 20TX0035 TaxID=3022019 RepID=UPI00232DD415|nr:hypothetical protein [Falsirhodobacter sp. 20TX0035]MDB6453471.1 hypothetical protein [Falsirhodobacter sp. 20TX0035]
MTREADPHDEAEKIRDERARAARSEEERQKIKDSPVEPLLKEPGRGTKEWD